MSVSNLKDRREKCPYCGIADTKEHPEFTCPRIASVTIGSDGYGVDFIEPKEWDDYKKGLTDASTG